MGNRRKWLGRSVACSSLIRVPKGCAIINESERGLNYWKGSNFMRDTPFWFWFWVMALIITTFLIFTKPAISESIYPWPLWVAMYVFTIPFVVACFKLSNDRPGPEPKLWNESTVATIVMGILLAATFWHLWCWWQMHKPVLASSEGSLIATAAGILPITAIGGLSRCSIVITEFFVRKSRSRA